MDYIKVTGIFECKIFENGKLIQEVCDKNLVVTSGLQKLAQIIATDTFLQIDRIRFGSSSTAPSLTDTSLTAPMFTKTVLTKTNPTPTSIALTWALNSGEANGNTIQEFGLFFADGGTLFARKTGVTVAKTPAITMTGTWTITLS